MDNQSNSESLSNYTIEGNILKGRTTELPITSPNVGEIFLKLFSEKPNHVAQVECETGKQTTFAEMKENSIRCALWMRKQGIGPSDVVAICTHNQLDDYIPCIAAIYVGAIYNPWHHEVLLKPARHLMSVTRPKLIFSCPSALEVLVEAARLENVDAKFVVFGDYPGLQSLTDVMRLQTAEEVRTFRSSDIEARSTGIILFSSGTTGTPKGVALSYHAFLNNLLAASVYPTKPMIILWYSTLHWITGNQCMFMTILSNSTRVLHAQFDPEETSKVIEKYKVNWLLVRAHAIAVWCMEKDLLQYELKSVEIVATSGIKLVFRIREEFQKILPLAKFILVFGMTELSGGITVRTDDCKSTESAGFPRNNTQIKIINLDNGQPLGPNQPGELCVKSCAMMIGYYNNPNATKATIDEEGWLHTGDKAYYDENGELYILDRLKEMIKFRGYQIFPGELEEILLSHPGVGEAAVVPVPHALEIERPMAFIKKVPGFEVTEDELVELTSALGDYKKLWGGVKFLEDMPHTPSGKINRRELKEMAKAYAKL